MADDKKEQVMHYCKKCHQAVRLRKKDNTWVHYGWKRMFEPYSWFLERTNHPVEEIETIVWNGSPLTVVEKKDAK